MSLERAVQDELLVAGIRAEVLKEVYDLLDREAKKSRDHGDTVTAEVWELARAKMRVLEK